MDEEDLADLKESRHVSVSSAYVEDAAIGSERDPLSGHVGTFDQGDER